MLELVSLLAGIVGVPDVHPTFEDERPGDVKHSQADISAARELLGYDPRVSFEEGLRRTVEWIRATEASQGD